LSPAAAQVKDWLIDEARKPAGAGVAVRPA